MAWWQMMAAGVSAVFQLSKVPGQGREQAPEAVFCLLLTLPWAVCLALQLRLWQWRQFLLPELQQACLAALQSGPTQSKRSRGKCRAETSQVTGTGSNRRKLMVAESKQ